MDRVTAAEWQAIVNKARIVDPDTGSLLGYVHDGKAYGTISALRREVELRYDKYDLSKQLRDLERELENWDRNHHGGYPVKRQKKSSLGVLYFVDSNLCICHSLYYRDCPTWRTAAGFNSSGNNELQKLRAEVKSQEQQKEHYLNLYLGVKKELNTRPTIEKVKEVPVPKEVVVYRDKVENVSNDPDYNIRIQDMYLADAEKRRVQANILSVLFVLGIAGATPFLMLTLWAFVPIGVLSVALGIANGRRAHPDNVLERKVEKIKWETRRNLALQNQMQMYLSEPTTGSTLPITSGTAQKRLPM